MNTPSSPIPRRHFIAAGLAGLAGAALGGSGLAAPVDSGQVQNGKINLPQEKMPTDSSEGTVPAPTSASDRIGFAVVGLGRLSLDQILPAFGSSKRAKLVALVSGTPDKAALIAGQYGVKPESIYSYEKFDSIRDNPEIKAVYIVLPNSLHAEYTVRAAKAGKHVLCEKPMATSVAEAQQMIDACAQAQVKLMIAYRCQYEVANRWVIENVRKKTLGQVGLIEACNLQNQAGIGQWRLKKALAGGGSLPDVGLYCLNTTRAVLEEEPTEVFATISNPPNDPRFAEVESTISFVLRFPSGAVANCSSSYSLHETRRMRLYGSDASASLENAFAYHGQELMINRQQEGASTTSKPMLEAKNQFALELDHLATCISRNLRPHTPGEEGLQDHRIMEAIYQSAKTGQPVKLNPITGTRGPDPVFA